ncbi:MAG: alkaline phosphatase family protein [Candidatus Nanohalobium sp.]
MSKVLVVAFDGLDKELIEQFGLENIKMSEFGSIDNSTGITDIKTSELFASFITGETSVKHKVTGLKKQPETLRWRFINFLTPKKLTENIRGFYRFRETLKWVLNAQSPFKYTREDIDCPTIFDEMKNSRAMFVPSYNPDFLWDAGGLGLINSLGYSRRKKVKIWDERSYEIRKNKLFSELENDIISPRDFLMVHFHRPDFYQHLYGDKYADMYEEGKLKQLYRQTEDLAVKIKNAAKEAGYTHIIFMSDHGLPTEYEHNENAFYSCNKELFGDETPHITDFHDKILKITGGE